MTTELPARDENETSAEAGGVARRTVLRVGAVGGVGVGLAAAQGLVVPALQQQGLWSADGVFTASATTIGDLLLYNEAFPTSPLILEPFNDELVVPQGARAGRMGVRGLGRSRRDPGRASRTRSATSSTRSGRRRIGLPGPDRLRDQRAGRRRTVHHVAGAADQPRSASRRCRSTPPARPTPRARVATLPPSTIYGFNGTFPGPMINAEYGKPALVRFNNQLDENPENLDRQDFGRAGLVVPDPPAQRAHGAGERRQPALLDASRPEAPRLPAGDVGRQPVPELAGGQRQPGEAELLLVPRPPDGSHRLQRLQGHGRVVPDLRPEERHGHGRRDPGSAPARCAQGTTPTARSTSTTTSRWRSTTAVSTTGSPCTRTSTTGTGEFPGTGNPRTHPEWWGKTFFKHFPNHGFVGDIFTVNGTAYPVLEVKRRKYRFRFLDASVARIYEFKLMSSTQGPKSAVSLGYTGDELQGQYRIPDGQQCMKFTQIASDGGLLPFADHPGLVRAVAGQAARVHRRLHQVQGRHADHQGRRHLPDQRDEDARRPDVDELVAVLPRPEVQGAGAQVRHRRRRARQQPDPGPLQRCGPAAAAEPTGRP